MKNEIMKFAFMFLNWLRMKVLRWSVISGWMKSRITQVAPIIPIAGYAILWSGEFDKVMEWSTKIQDGAIMSPNCRLYLVYWGAISISAAILIFRVRCPHFIQRHTRPEGYILEQEQTLDGLREDDANLATENLVNGSTNNMKISDKAGFVLKTTLMLESNLYNVGTNFGTNFKWRVIYLQNDDKRFWSIIFTLAFFIFGVLCFLAPSAEVLYLVFRSML